VEGNSLNSSFISEGDPTSSTIVGDPQPLESGLPELKVLSFDIEACNPKGIAQEKKTPSS